MGLTTAATMWATTVIGLAIGSGHELLGILLAGLVYAVAAWGEWPVFAGLRGKRDRRARTESGEILHVHHSQPATKES